MLIVQKYGGSSVKDAERIRNVTSIIKNTYEKLGKKPKSLLVVLSAAGGITDMLINAAKTPDDRERQKIFNEILDRHKKICSDLEIDYDIVSDLLIEAKEYIEDEDSTKKTMDVVQSFGERLSTRILSAYLNKVGIPSKQWDAYDAGVVTNDEFGNAEILPETYTNIKKKLGKFEGVPVVTGFIGKTKKGDITTLGRGGSDYSGAIFGAALDADVVEIWTDVNGIMTADPRIVKNAKTVPVVSFSEASELAFFGAKVLHPKTILPVVKKDIPVKILNTYEPEHPGTIIVNRLDAQHEAPNKAIAFKKSIQVVNVNSLRMLDSYGFLAKMFEVFKKHKVSVDMIATSEVSVSITLEPNVDLSKVVEQLQEFSSVKVSKDKSLICVVGQTSNKTPGELGKIFTILGKEGINIEMISQGASEVNIAFVVNQSDMEKGVLALHKELFEK